MTATVHDLLAELGHAHDFAGAPCVGRWRWFDPPGDHEPAASVRSRHEAAVHLCGTCPLPTFARCAATVRALPKSGRRGVWAGQSFDLKTTIRSKEKKRMTENVPYPMPVTIARGTITVTKGDEQPRTHDVFVAMPATTPTDTVLLVFGEELRRKAALAAGLDALDALPTAEDE